MLLCYGGFTQQNLCDPYTHRIFFFPFISAFRISWLSEWMCLCDLDFGLESRARYLCIINGDISKSAKTIDNIDVLERQQIFSFKATSLRQSKKKNIIKQDKQKHNGNRLQSHFDLYRSSTYFTSLHSHTRNRQQPNIINWPQEMRVYWRIKKNAHRSRGPRKKDKSNNNNKNRF